MSEEKNPKPQKRPRTFSMDDEQQAQGITSSLPLQLEAEPLMKHQRAKGDALTPFISNAPPLRSPPPRMRILPKPSDIVECRPKDIERLSLPVLSMDDLANDSLAPPPLPINIRRRHVTEFSRSVCGKRTRPTENRHENPIFKSATLQYAGISGRTIYADPFGKAKEIITNDIKRFANNSPADEDFYVPMPKFTQATRSALPHVLQLPDC